MIKSVKPYVDRIWSAFSLVSKMTSCWSPLLAVKVLGWTLVIIPLTGVDLPSSVADRLTEPVQLLILFPPNSDYWPQSRGEGDWTWKATSVTVLHTYFVCLHTQQPLHTWMHTHTLCLSPLFHTDKQAAAWTLKIRSWSCERGGMKYVCACLCLFVSVCVCFSSSAEGEGDLLYRTSWEWRASETEDEPRTTSSPPHSKQGSHAIQIITQAPEG